MSDDNKIINKTLPLKYKVEEGIKNPSTIPIKNNKERCPTKTGHFATGLKNNWQQVEGNWKVTVHKKGKTINLTTGLKNNRQQVEGNRKVTIHKKDERANNYDKEVKLQQEKEEQELKDQQHLRQQLKNNERNEKETDTRHNYKWNECHNNPGSKTKNFNGTHYATIQERILHNKDTTNLIATSGREATRTGEPI